MDSFRKRFGLKKVDFIGKGLYDVELDRILIEYNVLKYIKIDFAEIFCQEMFEKSGAKSFVKYMIENKNKLVD